MLPNISLGPVVLPTSGLIIIAGIWIVLTIVERSAKKLNLDAEKTYTLVAVSLASGFIGARLVFVVLHWDAYRVNLSGIVWPLTSGYDLWAGLLFAIAAGFFYGRAKRLPAASTLDALAPGLLTALLAVSMSDFLAGPGYGLETTLPWAIDIYGIDRHPVQVYEILVAIGALVAWRFVLPRRSFDGQLFLVSAAVYAGGRLFVDAFRANPWLTGSGLHVIQMVCLTIVLICIILLARNSMPASEHELESDALTG